MKELAALPLWVIVLQIVLMIICMKLVHALGYLKGWNAGRIYQMGRWKFKEMDEQGPSR